MTADLPAACRARRKRQGAAYRFQIRRNAPPTGRKEWSSNRRSLVGPEGVTLSKENNDLPRRSSLDGGLAPQGKFAPLANPADDPPAETETAGPAGTGTGGNPEKACGSRSLPYHHPERVATRERSAAVGRMVRVMTAYKALQVEERPAFAGWLFGTCWVGQPVPAFDRLDDEARDWARWADLAELRTYRAAIDGEIEQRFGRRVVLRRRLVDLWQRLPEPDRRAFVLRVSGNGRTT
jgi:hypothetical protein